MPRKGGKKKKGRVIKPGFEAMQQNFNEQLNAKLNSVGLSAAMQNLNLPTAAQTSAEGDSQLDASVYTYYSESVNMNDETPSNAAQETSVQNIQAQLEQANSQEESKV